MFVHRSFDGDNDAAARLAAEHRRAQLETRNDALRFLMFPLVLELGAQFFSLLFGWDWILTWLYNSMEEIKFFYISLRKIELVWGCWWKTFLFNVATFVVVIIVWFHNLQSYSHKMQQCCLFRICNIHYLFLFPSKLSKFHYFCHPRLF